MDPLGQLAICVACFVIFYGTAIARFWFLQKRNHRISWHTREGSCSIIIAMMMVVGASGYVISSGLLIDHMRCMSIMDLSQHVMRANRIVIVMKVRTYSQAAVAQHGVK